MSTGRLAIWSAVLLMFLQMPVLGAQVSYRLSWYTIDGGGGKTLGGRYVLTGVIGQPDAGYSSGDKYELLGGFLPGGPLCMVGFDDFAKFAEQWLHTGSGLPGDIDADNDIDFGDLARLADLWLACCPYGWPLR
jgi:hypothetical protein